MPIVLRNNGRVMRLASGRVLDADGDTSCCCGGQATCQWCGAKDASPALICPPQLSLTASISFTLKSPSVQEAQDYRAEGGQLLVFDEYSISKAVCLFAVGAASPACGHQFASVEPIVSGWVQSDGPPGGTYNVRRFAWYLGINFDCDGTITAEVRGLAIKDSSAGNGDGLGFSTFARDYDDVTYDTSIAWARTCDTSGSIDNSVDDDGSMFRRNSDNGEYYYGYGGSVSFGGDCGGGDCSTCAATSYLVEVTSGPAATLTFGASGTVTRVGTTGCVYLGTGTDDDGNPVSISLTYGGTDYGVIVTRTTPTAIDVRGTKRCAGEDGEASGDYTLYNDEGDLVYTITVE